MLTPTRVSPDPPLDTREQYAELLASIDGIVWEADVRTFRFTFVSQQAERLFGYPLADWLAPAFWDDHIHPEDRDWVVGYCLQASRERGLYDFEYRMIAADGRVVWLRDIVTVVTERGEPTKLRGIMVDVTERKRVEEERQEQVRFLESLDRVNRAIQGATDMDAMMRDVLDAVLAVFGCDRAWLVYPCDPLAPTWRAVMERTRAEYPGAFQAGVELPVQADVAEVYRVARATSAPVLIGPGGDLSLPEQAAALFSIRSQLCTAVYPKVDRPYLFGIHQCSHPRVWTASEQRLFQEIGRRLSDALTTQLAYGRLHTSETRFRVLVDHATDAFFLHDADGIILDVNRQACVSLGYSREELIGTSPTIFDAAADPNNIVQVGKRLVAGEVIAFDTQHRRKDGTVFPVEVRIRPFREGGQRYAVSLARDITGRKKVEEAVRQREADLSLALDAGRMGEWKWVLGEPTVFWSDRCRAIYGLSPEVEVTYELFLSLVHPDDRDRIVAELQQTAETGVDYDSEKRIIRPDGSVRWTATRARAFRDASGRIASVAGLTTDVTDRKQAEESLRVSEQRLEAAQRIAHVGWWERDIVNGRASRSSESYRIFGLDPAPWGDLATWDHQWRERIHPDDIGRTTEALRRAQEGGPRYDLEYRILRPSGEVRVVHSQGDVTFDAERRPIRMFGTMQDVTELRHVEDDLRASESRFRTFVDHATDAFFLLDARGNVLDVNRQACESLGRTREELIGLSLLEFNPAVGQSLFARLQARLDAGEVIAFDTQHRRKDGTVFPVEVRVRPFWQGGQRYAVSLVRDITDRTRLEEQFRQAQKMEAVGRLAGGIAHDFNNLLTVINCYSEMVFDRFPADDPSRELVAEIQKSGERAAELTRQLLAFSRKQVLLPQVVNANALIEGLAKMLRRLIGEDIELALDLDPQLGLTKVDPGQFEQAVINLVVNARDAMPDGGRVTVATRNADLPAPSPPTASMPLGPHVVVSVSDAGHGMDEATKARIFEPFFTTKGLGQGTGLGLAMVYGFVTQSGGHVVVDSEPGRGTTFRVYLPRSEALPTLSRTVADKPPMPVGTETILLVEDEESVRDLSRTILESCGYRVLEARDGEQGVAVAQKAGAIDLLVTDLVMPRMSGRRLADTLLAIRPHLRVLFLSGYTDEAALTRGVNSADVAFLHKPFTITCLAQKVREVLDQRSA